jgi:hypothetical protein
MHNTEVMLIKVKRPEQKKKPIRQTEMEETISKYSKKLWNKASGKGL